MRPSLWTIGEYVKGDTANKTSNAGCLCIAPSNNGKS